MLNDSIGNYIILKEIGAGGMGTVYLAKNKTSSDLVAIKLLREERGNPELLERFRREGETLSKLNHPNIISLLDAFEDGGRYLLVMEYEEAGDLEQLLHEEKNLPIERGIEISLELADALTRAHHLGIIHRDIKPANVLIGSDGNPRLSDFGVAHYDQGADLTQEGALIGTVAYISPEGCQGMPLDERSDIWSFGVLMYEMLTGDLPFRGESILGVISAILSNPLPDLEANCPEAPSGLVDLIYRMLAKNPLERIPSARLVGAELEAMLKGFKITPSSAIPVRADESLFALPAPELAESRQHNLPRQTAPIIGRETEIKELSRLICETNHPLISIIGPGGIGKSRLVLETGELNLDHFQNGVFFVELAPLNDPANIPALIAESTGYGFTEYGSPEEQVLSYLTNKQMLLIFDNYEHLLPDTTLISKILRVARGIKVLVTSRERLNLSNENVYTLDALNISERDMTGSAIQSPAVQLFIDSARRAKLGFEIEANDLEYIRQICHETDGLPLGIILAAAWVDTLSLQEIAEEIKKSIDFLESDYGDLPRRHRSMRAAFNYSWKMLSQDERDIFAMMSVFHGDFSRQAVQQITGVSLRMLLSLVNKSLVSRNQESGQYHIHGLLRQMAGEHFEASGQSSVIKAAHSSFYLAVLTDQEQNFKGRNQAAALKTIDEQFENIRAAFRFAVEQDEYNALNKTLFSLWYYCLIRSRFFDGEKMLRIAREKIAMEKHPVGLRIAIYLEEFLRRQSFENSKSKIESALNLARENGDLFIESEALWILAWSRVSEGNYLDAISLLERCYALRRSENDLFYQGELMLSLGYCHFFNNNFDQSLEYLNHALEIVQECGNQHNEGTVLNNLGVYAELQGNLTKAESYHRQAYTVRKVLGNRAGMVWSSVSIAGDICALGQTEEGLQLALEGVMIAEEIAEINTLSFALSVLGKVYVYREEYEKAVKNLERLTSMPIPQPLRGFNSFSFLSLAYFGLDKLDTAFQHHLASLKWANRMTGLKRFALRNQALFLFQRGHHERAIELLGLFYANPFTKPDHETMPLVQQLLDRINAEISRTILDAAWERGENQSVDEVFQMEFDGIVNFDEE